MNNLINITTEVIKSNWFKSLIRAILQRLFKNKEITNMINKLLLFLALKIDAISGVKMTSRDFSYIMTRIKSGKLDDQVLSLMNDIVIKLQTQLSQVPELAIFSDTLYNLTQDKYIKLYRDQIIQLLALIIELEDK